VGEARMTRQKRHLPQRGRAGGTRRSWISLTPELRSKIRDRLDITSTRSWAFVTLTLCSGSKDHTNLQREQV
jgi:hypothetical protein